LDTLERLADVFREVFDDDDLTITRETTARDVDEWDSLMHVTLITRVESEFGVRFSSSEVAALQSAGMPSAAMAETRFDRLTASARFDRLTAYVRDRYPQFATGIAESRAVSPERFDRICDMYLAWAERARGEDALERSVDAFVRFTTDVNLAQARYEASGRYEHRSFDEVYAAHYSQDDQMEGYLWGVYLTNFLWAHHLEICLFFRDRFVSRLAPRAELVEIAPGHGGWGVWALHEREGATLRGFDISAASIEIATAVAAAAAVGERAVYEERNALDLAQLEAASADAVICSFLVEHLEEPDRLFGVIRHLLRPGGVAYVTGALTAAQIDHIYEIEHESELVAMAEAQGLRAVETFSANPKRLLPRARFVPRSMAMLLVPR